MIRAATHDDISFIYDMTVEFNAKYYDVPLDPTKAFNWITMCVEDGTTFVSPTGYIGGLLVPDPVRNWTALVEFGWFDTGRSGLLLARAFIQAGRDLGADEVRMCTMSTSPPIAETLVRRLGFSTIETSHRLIIKEP